MLAQFRVEISGVSDEVASNILAYLSFERYKESDDLTPQIGTERLLIRRRLGGAVKCLAAALSGRLVHSNTPASRSAAMRSGESPQSARATASPCSPIRGARYGAKPSREKCKGVATWPKAPSSG